MRCGQPEIGWLGWRNTDDEKFLESIPLACALNPGTRKHASDDDDRLSGSSLNDEGTISTVISGLQPEKTCLWGMQTTKMQPAHLHSLISAFVLAYSKVAYLNSLQAILQTSS